MKRSLWETSLFVIHVGATHALGRRLEREARAAGGSIFHLALQGLRDRRGLCDRLAETFMFPYASAGLDGAIDLISDLEWFGNVSGYLVLVDNDGAADSVVADIAGILPAIVDRWRTQGVGFVVVMLGESNQPHLRRVLDKANSELDEAGALPWAQPGTGRVTIEVHVAEVSGDGAQRG